MKILYPRVMNLQSIFIKVIKIGLGFNMQIVVFQLR